MAYNHEYPYVDPNRYNADWILHKIMEVDGEMKEFEALNKITFAGEWDITKQYPAWCIVNWNNEQEGYISIKPVPVGVTIDNTEYWASVVNYTATIADLQNRVVSLENDVMNLNDAVSALSDGVSGKKFLFISDSYGNYQNTANRNMIEQALYNLDSTFTDFEDIHVGSTGFSTSPTNFSTMLAGATSADVTDIIVIGASNDMLGTPSDIRNGIQAFEVTRLSKYPNAKVTVFFMSTSFVLNEFSGNIKADAVYRQKCAEYGYKYVDARYTLGFNTDFRSDLVHPATNSVDIMAEVLSGVLANRGAINGEFFTETPTAGTWFTNGSVTHGNMAMSSTVAECVLVSNDTTADFENCICHILGDARAFSLNMKDLFRTVHTIIRGGNYAGRCDQRLSCMAYIHNVTDSKYQYVPGYAYVSSVDETEAQWAFLSYDESLIGKNIDKITIYLR